MNTADGSVYNLRQGRRIFMNRLRETLGVLKKALLPDEPEKDAALYCYARRQSGRI